MFSTEFITLFLIISMRKISIIRCVYSIYMQKMQIFIYDIIVLLIYFINFAIINNKYKLLSL